MTLASSADFDSSPATYAKRLAGYITCPTTIRANTLRMFGRSPSLDIIQRMMAEANRPSVMRKDVDAIPDDDGLPWRPRGLVASAPPAPVKPPRKVPAAKPPKPVVTPIPVSAKRRRPTKIVTADDVISAIAYHYGYSTQDLMERRRLAVLVFARGACVHALRQRGNSYPSIARMLGGYDHSTMINAADKFAKLAGPKDWAIVHKCRRVSA